MAKNTEQNNSIENLMVDEDVNCIPRSTVKSRAWGCKIFEKYCSENALQLNYQNMSEEELAYILEKFYDNVCKVNGKPFSPPAMIGIRASINSKFRSPPFSRDLSINEGKAFAKANEVFRVKCLKSKKLYPVQPKDRSAVSAKDLEKLADYFSSYASDPDTLLEFVFINFIKLFWKMLSSLPTRQYNEGPLSTTA